MLLADEDEWGRGGVGVVGAGGELENFLDGPRGAGEDDDAGLGMGEQPGNNSKNSKDSSQSTKQSKESILIGEVLRLQKQVKVKLCTKFKAEK